jgi:hypothetical protein
MVNFQLQTNCDNHIFTDGSFPVMLIKQKTGRNIVTFLL